MRIRQLGTALSLIALLAGCGGGGSSGGSDTIGQPPVSGTPPPPPPPPTSTVGCSLSERKTWVTAQMNEWYLFPETLPANPSPASFSTVEDYLDSLTATARSQGRDRYFTYLTSIAEENAYYNSGSSAGFGFRLSYDTAGRRVFVAETFEGTPALGANIDRGTEILAIGTSAGNLQLVSTLMATGNGPQAVTNALGPTNPGVTRVLRVRDQTGATRDVTLSKTDYELTPVSSRYGAKILDDGGRKIGYLNLRTFINTADPALRNAFASFKAAGVSEVIVDVRYNGGGLVSIAELMGDLLGANRSTSDVFSFTTFRPSKSQFNETRTFSPLTQSIAPTKIAFIGTGGTASASELVINAFVPYLGNNMALVGTNTYGKPVGQIALDRSACDDRLRVVAFATQNAAKQGNYYGGLAGTVPQTCQAGDDLGRPLGDPAEASVARALDFLAGRSCTPITSSLSAKAAKPVAPAEEPRMLLSPERPSTAQREVPGLF
ncbi:MAG TPA: S41 family peptidase [Allosphingosinicella sp.]|jgi:C-terminal processing protease CtpA/Prc